MSGRKDDHTKNKLSLIPATFIKGIGRVLTFGANKYSERNWEEGMDYDRVFSAMQRHLWDWWGGEKADPETGISHLYHAACNLMFLATYEQREMGKEFDRRFKVAPSQYELRFDIREPQTIKKRDEGAYAKASRRLDGWGLNKKTQAYEPRGDADLHEDRQ